MADTLAGRTAELMRDWPIERITRDLDARAGRAAEMTGAAFAEVLAFNAELVTALRSKEIWPNRGVPRDSAFKAGGPA